MKPTLLLLAVLSCSIAFATQSDDEAVIKTIVQSMQEGWNKKDGAGFAEGFAPQHDYINILGLYLPNARKEGNARAHQQLFDTVYKDTDLQLRVAKFKFLTPDIALVHILGHTHPAGKSEEKRQEIVISGIFKRQDASWQIIAFQNTPVQQRPEQRPPTKS